MKRTSLALSLLLLFAGGVVSETEEEIYLKCDKKVQYGLWNNPYLDFFTFPKFYFIKLNLGTESWATTNWRKLEQGPLEKEFGWLNQGGIIIKQTFKYGLSPFFPGDGVAWINREDLKMNMNSKGQKAAEFQCRKINKSVADRFIFNENKKNQEKIDKNKREHEKKLENRKI